MSTVPALSPRLLAGLLGLGSASCLAAAFWFEFAEGLEPCLLCIYQRWAHGVTLALAAVCVVFIARRFAPAMLACLALAFLAGAAIAVWHVMVEWQWVAFGACSADLSSATTVEDLQAALESTDVVRCDEVPWSFAGVSMAGLNAIVSLAMAAAALLGCLAARRNAP